jgi:acetyl esterase/lipase
MTNQTEAPMSTTEAGRPTHPPFDPELVPTLAAIEETMPEEFTLDGIPAVRAAMAEGVPGVPPFDLTMGGAVRVAERAASGPPGAPDLTLLILSPARGTGPWPAIYHIHGGGMVLGSKELGAEMVAELVAEVGAVGVSVEYRLAPEHPDPAPVEDCYAGLVWTADHAAELDIDPANIVVVGTSAGGGLAAGTALLARDRGGPALSHQVLVCPMLDDRFITPSSRELDGEGVWDRNANAVGWTALLGDRRGGPDVSPYAAPARATDLSGLPRTYLDCGSAETFRDETIDYAQRLSGAGVSVDLHIWGGGFHGFDRMVPDAAISRASRATRHEFLLRALTG